MEEKLQHQNKIFNEFNQVISDKANDIKNENANMNANTASGKMMKFASISAKEFALENYVKPEHAQLHNKTLMYIHDLDFYATKSATCVQYNLQEIFTNGFKTRNGLVREPQSIGTYAELTAIVFQTAQNEMHGGQSVPAFDYFLSEGVNKSYRKALVRNLEQLLLFKNASLTEEDLKPIKKDLRFTFKNVNIDDLNTYLKDFALDNAEFTKLISITNKQVVNETDQAMEGFIYNLNTQHSRGGNQVVFSSINLGTDTSKEGRQVTRSLLKALRAGLGNGETSIFPIVIFKLKTGVNFDEDDYKKVMSMSQDEWFNEELRWNAKNFDLFLDAIRTTSQRLFPNFMFLDQPFNQNVKWNPEDKNSWYWEPATMGCRTRVFENINGDKTTVGRGNLSFTSINLPYVALDLLTKNNLISDNKIDYEKIDVEQIKQAYIDEIEKYANIACEQLYERFKFQASATALDHQFLMQNNVLNGGGKLKPTDSVEEVLKQGTLVVGFVGLAEALKALLNAHHGESNLAQKFGLAIVTKFNEVTTQWKEKTHLNFGVLGTPAESVAGKMALKIQEDFGVIEGVSERDYLTNSNHVPVYYNISALEKVKIEAAYHPLTLAGSISYIELDGEAKKNLHAVLSVVNAMRVYGTNYGSLNHPVDRCRECNYTSLIPLTCQMCGSDNISRTRRITGYLVGDLDCWNNGKVAEEKDRVKHNIVE